MQYSINLLSLSLCVGVFLSASTLPFNAEASPFSDRLLGKERSSRSSGPKPADLISNFNESCASLLLAQSRLNLAFGLKEEAAQSATDYAALTTGGIDKDQMKSIMKRSKRNDELLAKKMDETKSLSKEGRKHYVDAIVPFAFGIYKMSGLKKDYENFTKNQSKGNKLLKFIKDYKTIKMAIYIGKELPGYFGSFYSTSSKMLSFANKQKIPVPKKATDYLDQL